MSGISEHIVTFSSSTIKHNHLLNTDVCYNITDVIYNQKLIQSYILQQFYHFFRLNVKPLVTLIYVDKESCL